MGKKEERIIKKTTEELLKLLSIDGSPSFNMGDEVIEIVLDTKDSGMVIGYHGETLEAFQLILSLCVAQKIGRFIRVSLEVGDYKKNRTEWLENMAIQTKERALLEKREILLPNLKSWERRIVHLFLQNDAEVVSESIGEGKDRTLVIRAR